LNDSSFSDFGSDDEIVPLSDSSDVKLYKFKLFNFREVRSKSGPKPKPRSGHRIIYFNGKIYSFGGYNPDVLADDPAMADDAFWSDSIPLFKELWSFNLFSRRWVKCSMEGDIPEQLASHTAAVHPCNSSTMLVYGGTGAPFGLTTSDTVVSCDLKSLQFSPLTVNGAYRPQALYGQAIITDPARGLLYTVGGTSGFHYFMDVDCLDLEASPFPAWTSLYRQKGDPGEPESRYRHELALFEGQIYVLGGGTSFTSNGFKDLPTFDIKERRWTFKATKPDLTATIEQSQDGYPDARRCHGCVQLGSRAWVIGGYDGDDIYGDVWSLELGEGKLQWSRLRLNLPVPVYFHAVTTTEEGKLYMFGGVDDLEQNTRTDKVFSSWLSVPSLRAMAWEAVSHYYPHLEMADPAKLVEEGVPRDCVERLKPPFAIQQEGSNNQAAWG